MANFNGERHRPGGQRAIGLRRFVLMESWLQAWAPTAQDLQSGAGRAPGDSPQRLVDMRHAHLSLRGGWDVAARADAGDAGNDWWLRSCTLKNQATQTMQFCDAGVQILGGIGFYAVPCASAPLPREAGHHPCIGGGNRGNHEGLAAPVRAHV